MNLIKILRKPYLSIFLASLILFVSCEQYDTDRIERSFDYALYNAFKNQNLKIIKLDLQNIQGKISLVQSKDLLQIVNNEYGSDLFIPDNTLDAMFNISNAEEIKTFALEKGLLNKKDIVTLESFVRNIEASNFDTAIKIYEEEIISKNLTDIEFEQYNNVASSFKILNDDSPEFFNNNYQTQQRGVLGCVVAYVVWVAALIGLVAGCATVFLCAIGFIGLASASAAVVTQCAIK